MWIVRDETQNAVHSVSIILEYQCDLLHVRAFLAKRNRSIGNSVNIRWTLFQCLSMSLRTEDFVDIDMKNSGDKEYFTAKNFNKRDFQGIHDRFPRDQEFCIRMIEHSRDEEVCRRWDAFADEDHPHHLTAQEYFHYKSKWWFHSNKQGSNVLPSRRRFDFKQALSNLHRLQQEAGEEPHVLICSNKHKQWEARNSFSAWWNWQGSWWTPDHSEWQGGAPVLSERC